jgi:hypothetical protein
MMNKDQDPETSLTSPYVHCERCELEYEYWQLHTCERCHKHCCLSCVHALGVPAERLGMPMEIEEWYCLECYEKIVAA